MHATRRLILLMQVKSLEAAPAAAASHPTANTIRVSPSTPTHQPYNLNTAPSITSNQVGTNYSRLLLGQTGNGQHTEQARREKRLFTCQYRAAMSTG